MKDDTTYLCIIATTHTDIHGDKLTKTALETLTAEALPVLFWNHQTTFRPIAVVERTWIEALQDGEYQLCAAVKFLSEEDYGNLYESDIIAVTPEEAHAVAHEYATVPTQLTVFYDPQSSADADFARLIEDCNKLISTSKELVVHKSLDFLDIISTGLTYLVAIYTLGLVEELGKQTAEALLSKGKAFYCELGEKIEAFCTSRSKAPLHQIYLRTPGAQLRLEANVIGSDVTHISIAYEQLPQLFAMIQLLLERNPQGSFSAMSLHF